MPVSSVSEGRNARQGSYRAAWVLLIAALVCGTVGEVINKSGNPSKLPKHTVLLWGGIALGLWAIAVMLLMFAIRSFNKARRRGEFDHRQETGRRLAAEDVTKARRLAVQLLAGEPPAVGRVWDAVLQPGEQVLFEGTAGYSRYYGLGPRAGNDGSREAMLNQQITHSGTRGRAQSPAVAAAARWRDQQQCRVVVTDRRLLCQPQSKSWVNFAHAEATSIQTGPNRRELIVEYPGTAPLCLAGPVSTQIMVIIVWALYGADGLREHPALADVRAVAPLPEARAASPAEFPLAGGEPVSGAPRPDLLAFMATRELVVAEHAARLLGASEAEATEQLERLRERGLVSRIRLHVDSPTAYLITEQGSGRVGGAPAPSPTIDLAGYRQLVAVAER